MFIMKNIIFILISFQINAVSSAGELQIKTHGMHQQAESIFELFNLVVKVESSEKRPRPSLLLGGECDNYETYDVFPGRALLRCKREGVQICLNANAQVKFFSKRVTLRNTDLNIAILNSDNQIICEVLKK